MVATKTATAPAETTLFQTLMGFFRARGFSARNAQVASAAFLGNFQEESGFRPTAYNAHENAHGFAQWENGRWSGGTGLQHYAAAHHLNPLSTPAQTGYLQYELTHGYAGVVDSLRGQNNIDAATQTVQSRFEGSTPDTLGARQGFARSILDQITHGRPLSLGPVGSGAGSTTAASFSGGVDNAAGAPTTLAAALAAAKNGTLTADQMITWFDGVWRNAFTKAFAVTEFSQVLDAAKKSGAPAASAASIKGTDLSVQDSNGGFNVYPLKGVSDQGVIEHLKQVIGEAISAPVNAIVGAVEDWLNPLFKNIGRWAIDAFVIILGAVILVVAFVLVAKSTGTDVSTASGGGESAGKRATAGAPAGAEEAAAAE